MKLRSKLLFINGSLLITFLFSIIIYVLMLIPRQAVEEDKNELLKLEQLIIQYKASANTLPFNIFSDSKSYMLTLGQDTLDRFQILAELNSFKASNDRVNQALERIEQIRELLTSGHNKVSTALDNFERESRLLFGNNTNFKLMDIYTKEELTSSNIEKIKVAGNELIDQIMRLDFIINSSLAIISDQSVIIENEFTKIESKSLLITSIVILVLVSIVSVVAILTSSKIGIAISAIADKIILMKNRDISVRFNESRNDDIGDLCRDMNLFQNDLSQSIKNIQNISQKNIVVHKELLSAVNQTNMTSSRIDQNAVEISQKIESLKDNIENSSVAVDKVDMVFNTLNNQVAEQMAMVEESTAAVTEMISSIDSIARITTAKTEAVDQLVKTSANGSEKLNYTTTIINNINDRIDHISEMATIIKSISSQTNLLAMNAAIEAAHAGDSGRGFSVVADEIRKLAEASSKQSNEISANLKEIVENIENAQSSGNVTNLAFSEVDKEISDFSKSLYEISSSISELKNGGEQILSAMSSLQNVSINVKNSSNDLSDASESMKNEMKSVKTISQEVHTKISDVSVGIGEVSNSVNSINTLANSVEKVTENLNSEVSQFRTEQETE